MTVTDYEHQSLARLIDNVAEIAHDPDDCELCGVLDLRQHLHDVAGCVGSVGASGRCGDCGRLVALRVGHKEGPGCLYAIPIVGSVLWLVQHREAIPVLGNLLWRFRHRSVSGQGGARPGAAGQGGARQAMDAEAPTRPVEQTRVRATDQEKDT